MARRAEAALAAVRARISPETLRRRTGANLDGTHMAAKMRWLLDHPPRGRASAAFHQPVDYLVERLTGARVIDHGLASTTLVYDLAAGDFADDLLAAFDLRRGLRPALRPGDGAGGGASPAG